MYFHKNSPSETAIQLNNIKKYNVIVYLLFGVITQPQFPVIDL